MVDRASLDDGHVELDVELEHDPWSERFDLGSNRDRIDAVTLAVRDVEAPTFLRIFGRDSRHPNTAATPQPAASSGDWLRLAALSLDGIQPGSATIFDPDRWSRIAFESSCDLDMLSFDFRTGDRSWTPPLTLRLREGARSQMVELPDARALTSIEFDYTVIDTTSCALSVLGLLRTAVAPPSSSDPLDGWTLLGEDEVDLIDDVVEIDRDHSTWSKIAIVVEGDPVDVEAVELTFGGKKPKVQREDQARSGVIEIKGRRRAVSKVRLQYKKQRLDGSSRALIYAR